MIIEEITATYTRKFALPEYSNFEIFCSMKARLESTDINAKECMNSLIKACKEQAESEGEQRLKEFYDTRRARKEIKEPK
jgi:hypothetical protein